MAALPNAEHVRPLDLGRFKRHARELQNWTDLKLSESQELTARVYGATSLQALLKNPVFATEHEESWSDSRKRIAMVAQRLNVSEPQAEFLLQTWAPTSMQPVFHSGPNTFPFREDWEPGKPVPEEHRHYMLHAGLGPHAGLPEGCAFALVTPEPTLPGDFSTAMVVIVRPGRQARFMCSADFLDLTEPLQGDGPFAKALTEVRAGAGAAAVKKLAKTLKAVPLKASEHARAMLKTDRAPCRTTAAWLQEGPSEDKVFQAFREWKPWRQEDYPWLPKAGPYFHTLTHKGYNFTVFFAAGDVFVEAYRRGGREPVAQVQTGVGGVSYISRGDLFSDGPEGFYLAKYGSQPRGERLEGFDAEDALLVAQEFGMRSDEPTTDIQPFCAGPAGLSFARYLATHPQRAKRWRRERPGSAYIGDWYGDMLGRMEFELVRAGKL